MTDTLQRITTEFVESEDRVRIRGKLADRQVVVLWLTQRLLNRVVPVLIEWLNKQPARQLAADSTVSGAPTPPVTERGGEQHYLINQIDVACGNAGVRLTFFSDADSGRHAVGTLILGEGALSQWLEILLRQYRNGQWPEAAWEDWSADCKQSASPHYSLTVH